MKNTLAFLSFLALFFWGCTQPGTASETELQTRHIRDLIKAEPNLVLDVLRDHPLELMEILEKSLMAKREHDQRQQEQADLAAQREPEISADRPMRGNPDAPITVVEYSDFLCPYCSTAAATIKELMTENKDSVRLVFKHLPLNPVSRELALGFEALGKQDQNAAWMLHDMVFERQAEARANHRQIIAEVVEQSGVDPERFQADRTSQDLAELLERDKAEAAGFGFSGTPMFLVNGIAVRGAVPLQEFQRVIALINAESEAAPIE